MFHVSWPCSPLSQMSGGRGLCHWLWAACILQAASFQRTWYLLQQSIFCPTNAGNCFNSNLWEQPTSGLCSWLSPEASQSNANSWIFSMAEPQVRYPRSPREVSPIQQFLLLPTPENSGELESPLWMSQKLKNWNILPLPAKETASTLPSPLAAHKGFP